MKKFLLPFFFFGTVFMMVVMAKSGAPLKTSATPLGILNLEFANNGDKTAAIIKAWTPANNIIAAKNNTYYDFLFLFFYSGFLFLACNSIAAKSKGLLANAGRLISKAAVLAGLLDILENFGMLITLNGHRSQIVPYATVFFSLIKWGLVLLVVLYLITGLLAWAFRKFKH